MAVALTILCIYLIGIPVSGVVIVKHYRKIPRDLYVWCLIMLIIWWPLGIIIHIVEYLVGAPFWDWKI